MHCGGGSGRGDAWQHSHSGQLSTGQDVFSDKPPLPLPSASRDSCSAGLKSRGEEHERAGLAAEAMTRLPEKGTGWVLRTISTIFRTLRYLI